MIEIEKKYRLTPELLAAVEAKLNDSDAEYLGVRDEENIIYTSDHLRSEGSILRVRLMDGKATLTYKKRLASVSDAKEQLEYETEAADGKSLIDIVQATGFRPSLIYEKKRRTWKFPRAEVVLDELPFGDFMEIEGPITAIAELEMLLEVENVEPEPRTYPQMTYEFGTYEDGPTAARFPKK